MNLGEYRVAVKHRLGIPDNDITISNTRLDGAINGALKHIATTADWLWLFNEETSSIGAGTDRITLSPDVTKILYVATDESTLDIRQAADVVANTSVGSPSAYALVGQWLYVRPVPTAATSLKIGVVRSEPLLVSDTDAPLMPDAYSEWLISEAAVRIAIAANNADRISALREEAAVAKRSVIDNVRRTAGLPTIRRTRPSVWPMEY